MPFTPNHWGHFDYAALLPMPRGNTTYIKIASASSIKKHQKPTPRQTTVKAWFSHITSGQDTEGVYSFNLEPTRGPGATACHGSFFLLSQHATKNKPLRTVEAGLIYRPDAVPVTSPPPSCLAPIKSRMETLSGMSCKMVVTGVL